MLTTDYLPNIGGVAQHIYELSRALSLGGDSVEIIAPEVTSSWTQLRKPSWIEKDHNIKIYRIPYCFNKTIPVISGRLSWRLSRQKFSKEAIKRLQQDPPDVLHWHALDTFQYPAEGFQGKRIWTNHTSNFIEGIKTPRGLKHFQREASSANYILCPSEELKQLTIGIGIPPQRVHFIPNGVDAKRFNPCNDRTHWRRKLNISDKEFLILCPRRLEKKNGVRYFVQAAIQLIKSRKAQNIHFAVAGNFEGHRSDSDEDIVKHEILTSRTEGFIHLLGRIENKDIPYLYAASDIVVMPSLIEATSLSAMEAMATGKAIISTNVGGLPFLIRDQVNGILVPPKNPESLAHGISTLIEAPALAIAMGAQGRKRVEEELDWSQIAKETRQFYLNATF